MFAALGVFSSSVGPLLLQLREFPRALCRLGEDSRARLFNTPAPGREDREPIASREIPSSHPPTPPRATRSAETSSFSAASAASIPPPNAGSLRRSRRHPHAAATCFFACYRSAMPPAPSELAAASSVFPAAERTLRRGARAADDREISHGLAEHARGLGGFRSSAKNSQGIPPPSGSSGRRLAAWR